MTDKLSLPSVDEFHQSNGRRSSSRTPISNHHRRNFLKNDILEFEDIRSTVRRINGFPVPASHGLTPFNYHKNRYRDVIPYDDNRVRLRPRQNRPGSDYINASPIYDRLTGQRFIAAQGPTASTSFDFIRMIWELRIDCVVCVVDEADQEDSKCYRYWLNGPEEEFFADPFLINVVNDHNRHIPAIEFDQSNNYVVRRMRISFRNEFHLFNHFHFTGWPDRGCPIDGPDPVLNMLDQVHAFRDSNKTTNFQNGQNSPAPILVHCSAGCGRTGTLIAVDILMNYVQLTNHNEDGDELRPDIVYRIAKDLRRQRMGMIQTLDQYRFINLAYEWIVRQRSPPSPPSSTSTKHNHPTVKQQQDEEVRSGGGLKILNSARIKKIQSSIGDFFSLPSSKSHHSDSEDRYPSSVAFPTQTSRQSLSRLNLGTDNPHFSAGFVHQHHRPQEQNRSAPYVNTWNSRSIKRSQHQ